MKGAPPPCSYLVELMSHFAAWGATGVLIEWEDMLPFEGPLEVVRHPEAYTKEEVGRVLAAAKRSGLSVIPLVQTFGHLEFVLKHARFGSMREERDNYMDLCPESDGARALAFELVHQVAALHPGCPRLHIGCDEVFSLGTHALSRAKAASAGEARLFLDHAGAVMNECARLGIVPLLWHDMMARFDVDALRQVAKSRAEVVVWSYGLDVEDAVPAGMWSRFREAGLRVWGASAFKGASQPDAVWVPAARHVTNHQSWVARASQTSLQGVILTGWARFNHTAALCETLPAGLPSLALCMGVLRNGGYSDGLRRRVWAALGLPESLPLVPSAGELSAFHESGADPAFPGGAVFRVLAGLEGTRLQLARTMENRRLFCPPYTHRLSPPLWRRMGWHARSARAAVEAMRRQLTLAAVGVLTPAGLAEVLGAKFATLTQQAADVSRDMRGLLQQHSGLVGMHDVGAGRAA
ncbi:HEXD, partial [Symbiodinium sp. KB8]